MGTEIGSKEPPVFAAPAGCTKTGELSHRACEPWIVGSRFSLGASGDRSLGLIRPIQTVVWGPELPVGWPRSSNFESWNRPRILSVQLREVRRGWIALRDASDGSPERSAGANPDCAVGLVNASAQGLEACSEASTKCKWGTDCDCDLGVSRALHPEATSVKPGVWKLAHANGRIPYDPL